MKATMFRFTVSGLLAMLAVPLTYAQTRVSAAIPFDFYVGSKLMEAGQCEAGFPHASAVLIRCRGNRDASFAITMGVSSSKVPEEGTLVFRRYGDRYFLSQLWAAGDAAGRALPPSALERRLVQTAATRSTVVILAKR